MVWGIFFPPGADVVINGVKEAGHLNWPSNLGFLALQVELWAPTDNWSKSAISRSGTRFDSF